MCRDAVQSRKAVTLADDSQPRDAMTGDPQIAAKVRHVAGMQEVETTPSLAIFTCLYITIAVRTVWKYWSG